MQTIDCRGQSCPGPVISVKKALGDSASEDRFGVLVDSVASRDNVMRFARTRGCGVSVEELGPSQWRIEIRIPPEDREPAQGRGSGEAGREGGPAPREGRGRHREPVVFLTSDTLGRGDDRLGAILMEGFVRTLLEQDAPPDAICLMNSGVRLAVEGSPVADVLLDLTNAGCEVLVCGVCLEFLDLKDRLAVGEVSNMYDIQNRLIHADPVIRP